MIRRNPEKLTPEAEASGLSDMVAASAFCADNTTHATLVYDESANEVTSDDS